LARGIIFRSLPDETTICDVGIDLAHQLGHQTLFAWQGIDPILESPLNSPVFSQLRQANRPAIQTCHASFALAYILFFTSRYADDPECARVAKKRDSWDINTLEESLDLSLVLLGRSCEFTELDEALMQEMVATVESDMKAVFAETGMKQRRFVEFNYGACTWKTPRRCVARLA
jgi:hypothetical protein